MQTESPAPLGIYAPPSYGRQVLLVCLTGILFAVGGGVLGALVAHFLPDYYRGVFPRVGLAGGTIEWTHVGIGLGITQGFILGIVVGLVLIVGSWYRDIARLKLEQPRK